MHSKSASNPRDLRSHPPKPQNAQGFSTKIRAHGLLPAAGPGLVELVARVSKKTP